MITLFDMYYEDSKVKMDMLLRNKEKNEDFVRLDIQVSFEFNLSTVESNIVWTEEDISILKEQIHEMSSESIVGTLSSLEPDLTFMYIKDSEETEELTLYITLDSGLINSDIGTETGPTLKIITTEDKLIKWISNIEHSFLG